VRGVKLQPSVSRRAPLDLRLEEPQRITGREHAPCNTFRLTRCHKRTLGQPAGLLHSSEITRQGIYVDQDHRPSSVRRDVALWSLRKCVAQCFEALTPAPYGLRWLSPGFEIPLVPVARKSVKNEVIGKEPMRNDAGRHLAPKHVECLLNLSRRRAGRISANLAQLLDQSLRFNDERRALAVLARTEDVNRLAVNCR
jgi:hypothetical protein